MSTTNLTEEQLAHLGAELHHLKKSKDETAERIATIEAIFRDLGPGTHPGDVRVKAGAQTLDLKAIAEAYPVTERPDLYVGKPDTARIRNAFSPARLEQFTRTNQPTVEAL